MRTAMIDTMVFDALEADGDGRDAVLAAIRHGELRLRTTHVQEDQIAAIRDPVRRKALQRLPREVVPSSVARSVTSVSRTGRARVDPHSPYAAMRASKHLDDELIAEAASTRADVLVTEDGRLVEHAREEGLTVWSTADLVAWARAATP